MTLYPNFDSFFFEILKPGSPEYVSLIQFIQKLLRQFNLDHQYRPEEIIKIASFRIKTMHRDVAVTDETDKELSAAFRRICLNAMRELKNLHRNEVPESTNDASSRKEKCESEAQTLAHFKVLFSALTALSEGDRTILCLRYMHGKSWSEISHLMALSHHDLELNESNIQWQCIQAIKRLRILYEHFS